MRKEKYKFIQKECLANSVSASFQRAKIYESNTSEKFRLKLRKCFKNLLFSHSETYKSHINEETHCDNIQQICDELTKAYKNILIDRHFRYGVAQKGINLYLKYLWCFGKIEEPPHCPIDSIVLREAGIGGAWTKMDSRDEYKIIIDKIKKIIKSGQSLAEWELEIWNKNT